MVASRNGNTVSVSPAVAVRDAWCQRLKKAESRLFTPANTQIRLETMVNRKDGLSRDRITDIVTDDQLLEVVLEVCLSTFILQYDPLILRWK
jgi:hypothetical protein